MTPLNLPQTQLNLTRSNQKIYVFCPIRKKKLELTPEEWVRQHFIGYLMHNLAISKGKILSEFALVYNQMKRRADLVIVDDFGQAFMLIECKAPEIRLTDKTFFQIAQYQSCVPAKILILTNGIEHYLMNTERTGESAFSDDLSVLKDWIK